MKFVILHGTGSDSAGNWIPWLKAELEKLGHEVWAPDLPQADMPNIERYTEFLFSQGWDFNNNVIIGHSSGAVAILGLLQKLPTTINTAILAGAFTKRLSESPSWQMLVELFAEPFDYDAIKQKSDKFIFVHSTDDHICPIEQAEYLCEKLNGEMVELKGMGHFLKRLDPRFDKFPELLDIIKDKVI